MQRRTCNAERARPGLAWLELLLGFAAIVLLFQVFPSLFNRLVRVVDLRNWSQLTFFLVNVVVVLALVSVRFGPDWKQSWAKRKQAHRHRITKKRVDEEKTKKDLEEERKTIKRIIEGRSRRIY